MGESMKEHARRWKELGPILDEIRDRDIRQADTPSAIRMFNLAFRIALRDLPPRESSGLVEWQRWMAVWRQRG
jgi:hypothetical protein